LPRHWRSPCPTAISDVAGAQLNRHAVQRDFLLETLKAKKGRTGSSRPLRTERVGKIMTNILAKSRGNQPAEPAFAAKRR